MERILFVADGRSPIALNWIGYFTRQGYPVHLISMFPCQPGLELASLDILPTVFASGFGGGGAVVPSGSSTNSRGNPVKAVVRKLATPEVRTMIRHQMMPHFLPGLASRLTELAQQYRPDVVHAMRIPYEGMLAALALQEMPDQKLIVSIWGNDFTLHAPSTRRMTALTRLAMQRADAIHSDCYRDVRLARAWGFDGVDHVLPGAGGVQTERFHPLPQPVTAPVIINPRGLRTYVRNDVFFKAVSQVREQIPDIRVLCPSMAGSPQAETWVRQYELEPVVELLPRVDREEMIALFQQSMVAVSPSEHDGTPNTLLEAMACGCFPVAGDIESIREWITPGVNGLLHPPTDSGALADSLLLALTSPKLRAAAQLQNQSIITERADYVTVMAQALGMYKW